MSALIAVISCCNVWGDADSGPQPPCGDKSLPTYPDVGSPPSVKVWDRSDWKPPACTGWNESSGSTLVVTAARFRHSAGVDGLRRRIGTVSGRAGILYWSTTNKRWQPMIVDAYALAGPAGDQRRKDFSVDEIAQGQSLYVHQEDNLLGKATYRLRIMQASAGLLTFATENTSTIRLLTIPLFAPGEMQSICFLERESKEVWRYYSIARMGKQVSLLISGNEASLINRAVALYRHLAGIPTDEEPPASR